MRRKVLAMIGSLATGVLLAVLLIAVGWDGAIPYVGFAFGVIALAFGIRERRRARDRYEVDG